MKSPNGEKTALDASKNKDENSQGGSGQDSDVGFSEWQKGKKLSSSLNVSFNSR